MRRALALLCTIAPFVAAAIAGLSARHDWRMAWMAVAVTAVAYAVALTAAAMPRAASAGLSLILGTIIASGIATMSGARAPFGIIAVAVVLAAFATAGVWLRVPASRA